MNIIKYRCWLVSFVLFFGIFATNVYSQAVNFERAGHWKNGRSVLLIVLFHA